MTQDPLEVLYLTAGLKTVGDTQGEAQMCGLERGKSGPTFSVSCDQMCFKYMNEWKLFYLVSNLANTVFNFKVILSRKIEFEES